MQTSVCMRACERASVRASVHMSPLIFTFPIRVRYPFSEMKRLNALINKIYQLLYFIIAVFINQKCHVRFAPLLIFLKYAMIKIGMRIRDAADQTPRIACDRCAVISRSKLRNVEICNQRTRVYARIAKPWANFEQRKVYPQIKSRVLFISCLSRRSSQISAERVSLRYLREIQEREVRLARTASASAAQLNRIVLWCASYLFLI
jgi:hypothetical protein